MEEVNNSTKHIKTFQDIIKTLISSQQICYQLKVRCVRFLIKGKGPHPNPTMGG